jgi:hypothetical protein
MFFWLLVAVLVLVQLLPVALVVAVVVVVLGCSHHNLWQVTKLLLLVLAVLMLTS